MICINPEQIDFDVPYPKVIPIVLYGYTFSFRWHGCVLGLYLPLQARHTKAGLTRQPVASERPGVAVGRPT